MNIKLEKAEQLKKNATQVVLINNDKFFKQFLPNEEIVSIKKHLENNSTYFYNRESQSILFLKPKEYINTSNSHEAFRKLGYETSGWIQKYPNETVQLWGSGKDLLCLAEGLLLSLYRFDKYKSSKTKSPVKKLLFSGSSINTEDLKELQYITEAVYLTRNLVNEPVGYLTATQLGKEIKELAKEAGFTAEVLNKKKIESLKMGGLLGVNQGSATPPTFSILEYKSSKATNKKPYILVGKGVVYDTGGLSLKDSDGMSIMKCDMAGAGAVIGAFYAIAKNKLPIHVIGLIPATDNMPGKNAITPGDVITISNGTTVEVLNTDAEGRLILADALSFAKKYKPELVIDLATLTGAAARAIGKEGSVFMGNASETYKRNLSKSGEAVYERLVEFPLWEEYDKQLESDIADIKNIGGNEAGAITAGKFLEKFVDYEWLHLDIAGTAFLSTSDTYRSKNGTGVGVRLLYNFFKSL